MGQQSSGVRRGAQFWKAMVKKRKGWAPTYAKAVESAAYSIGQRLRQRLMGRISRQFAHHTFRCSRRRQGEPFREIRYWPSSYLLEILAVPNSSRALTPTCRFWSERVPDPSPATAHAFDLPLHSASLAPEKRSAYSQRFFCLPEVLTFLEVLTILEQLTYPRRT